MNNEAEKLAWTLQADAGTSSFSAPFPLLPSFSPALVCHGNLASSAAHLPVP